MPVFATGGVLAQGLLRTPGGEASMIVNTNGGILRVPLTGGEATRLATIPIPPDTTCTFGTNCLSLRDGAYLPETFGPLAGTLLVVGGRATTNTPAFASIVDERFAEYPYATQPSSLWSAAVPVNAFGRYGGVLVVNQGSGQMLRNGGVDLFAPDGSVQLVSRLSDTEVPYGAAIAPWNFGEFAGTLLVSDAQSGRIYSVDPAVRVRLFTTIPLAVSQTGLRQIAFAPQGWGDYANLLFVSVISGEVVVPNSDGQLVARIPGLAAPRAMRFADIDGKPALLIAETNASQLIYRAGPEHLVPVRSTELDSFCRRS